MEWNVLPAELRTSHISLASSKRSLFQYYIKTLWERIFGRGCIGRMILLTCLIAAKQLSPYPTRENKSFSLLLCGTTQYVPIHNKNPVTSWQCFQRKSTSSAQTCFQPNCNIRHQSLQPRTVRFIAAPLILTLWGRSTGIIYLFSPIALYSVFP